MTLSGALIKSTSGEMTYSANILGVICCTSQIGSTKVVGIVGWVCNLTGTRNRWYGVLSSCIIRDSGAFDGHVGNGATLRVGILRCHCGISHFCQQWILVRVKEGQLSSPSVYTGNTELVLSTRMSVCRHGWVGLLVGLHHICPCSAILASPTTLKWRSTNLKA